MSKQTVEPAPTIVLIVDDDSQVRDLVTRYLSMQGMQVHEADCSTRMKQCLNAHSVDVVLLDVNIGVEDGFDLARQLRQSLWRGGIIMLTGRTDMVDRVVGLELGADDYVAKPFELRELLARVRSVARRLMPSEAAICLNAENSASKTIKLQFANFVLDEASRCIVDESTQKPIDLTSGEFNLLAALANSAQRIMSRDQLLDKASGRPTSGAYDRTIDVQIGRLRKKLGDVEGKTLIKSVRNAGYTLAVPVKKIFS
jgi:two-component system, OmpR family, response regulator